MTNQQMCYRTNFLSKVILRADFSVRPLGPLPERTAFTDHVAHLFPHVEAQPLIEMSVDLTAEGTAVERKHTGTQWNHRKAIDGTAIVSLAPTFLTLEYGPGDYTSFDDFFVEFSTLTAALTADFGVADFDRIGLRYVNEIRLPGRALDWDGFIRGELVAATKAQVLPNGRLVRSMHQIAAKFEDDLVLFNYGIHNPDFPAPAVQRFFILDVDCSRQNLIPTGEALACVRRLNELATGTFEGSIEDGLRRIMGVLS